MLGGINYISLSSKGLLETFKKFYYPSTRTYYNIVIKNISSKYILYYVKINVKLN